MVVFAGLTGVSLGSNRSCVQLNSSLTGDWSATDSGQKADSAFYVLKSDSITDKSATHSCQFRLLDTAGEGSIGKHWWTENSLNFSLYCDDHCQSSDSQSVAESCGSDGRGESSSVEVLEASDTESHGRDAEWDSLSSVMELSLSRSLFDKSVTFPVQDEAPENLPVSDISRLSDGNHCANVLAASSSDASVGNESQLAQHQPLVFFIVGLLVGLSLGFFTCKYSLMWYEQL